MKEDSGSGNLRRPYGCLIVKKKSDGVMSNGVSLGNSKERKRPRLILSDSDSDPPPPNVASHASDVPVVRNCNSDSFERREEHEIDRKRKPGPIVYRDGARIDRNTFLEAGIERKRSRMDDIGVEERRTEIGRNGVLISKTRPPISRGKEYEGDSSRSIPVENRGHSSFDRSSNFPVEQKREAICMDRQRFEMKTDQNIRPGLLKRKFEVHHGKPIRVQGKNGVLKVMPRNENKVGAPERFFSPKKEEENIKGSGVGASERFFSPKKEDNRQGSGVGASYKIFSPKMEEENRKCFGVGASEKLFRSKKEEEEEYRKGSGVGAPKILFSPKKEENQKASGSGHYSNGKAPLSPPLYSENKSREKLHSASVADKKQVNLLKKLSTKHEEVRDQRTQVSETALSQDSKGVVSCSSKKEVSKKQRTLSSEPCTSIRHKEGEVKRGNGTEKQILREQIRQMLVNAGWTIDLRPRKNRDYQDSVYVSPSGTEYWSITKAYYAFQKHFEDEGRNQKHTGDLSSVTLIPEDVLSKLTRQTRKKIEREMKMQQKGGRGSKKAKETSEKKINNKHVKVKLDSVMNGENMNTNVTQDGNSLKVRIKGNSVVGPDTDDLAKHKKFTLDKAGYGNGEKKKQSGRALLVRNSSKGLNMEDDDFVPYTGKRTVLSWLIDMETVRLSGKVQYMNKKRTRAMLEGWITRDGIHCRCCSKILTVSKFELHAGSKLHHPFQNIIVETGVSLYQCQLDAWNKQDKCVRRGFHFIDVDGDDPNDDTCGICGDGGDLICCDGCPSTFHQSCLDIQMLPSGDWLCPNCSCKFCGGVDGCTDQKEDATLCSCSLCEEKYHRQCRQHADTISIGSDNLRYSFCGKACEKLFQKLQKLLGVKHELEAGFSWTLIQRSNLDSDASSREQCPKAECNSKIAVALTVMDECFLPVIDQRSGVNLIHNVVFNIGSNFNRVNYSGFYTAILERGDEIISAASIRIHGTRLAEMPFIGTRHTYRRQGMFRRLLNAIESALSSLSVEKLVIPAISELMHTWTTVFGFKSLEELHRQEVKTLNMLVFPSTDLLQKPLLKHKLNEVDVTESSEVDKAIEHDGNKHIMPERSDNTDTGSVEPDTCALVKRAVCDPRMNNGVSFIETDHLSSGASTYDTSDMIKNPSVASLGTIPNGPSDCSAPDTNVTPHTDVNHEKNLDVGTNAICKSSLESELHNSTEDDPHRVNVVAAAAVEIDLHSLDETSAKDTITHNVEGSVIDTSDGFQRTDRIVQSNSDRIERNVPKVECKADLCSVYSGICPPDKGAVYNCEMSCAVASSGTGLQGPVGSTYDTSDMTIKPLDSAVGSIPDGHSEEYAHATQFFLQHVNHGEETKSILGSSVESKLEDTKDDAHEVKVEAASVLDLHPFDVTPGQDISSIHDYPNAFSGNSRMSGNHVRNNYNLNEHNVQKMECGSEMVSFEHGICTGENNAVCDPKVNNGVTSFGTGSSGSTTSDMKGNPSSVALKPIPQALSAESVLQSKNPFPCINHETKLNVEMISSVDCKLQSSTEDGVLEAASSEHTNTDSSYPNAISGNKFWCTGGKRVEKGSDLNEHYIHSMGCASVEVFHDTSDVDYYKVDGLLNSEESTKQDASEVRAEVSAVASDLFPFSECRVTCDDIKRDVSEMKTEASAVESDLLPSDEGHVHRQLRFAAVGNTCQGSSENILCHDPALTGLSYGRVSDNNYPNSGGKLAHHCDFQLLQNVQDGSNSATGEATISCEVGNGVAPDRYKPQELVEDMMDSTSEVSGTIW